MKKKIGSERMHKAYVFLLDAEAKDRTFSINELSEFSGWSLKTADAMRSKKLPQHIIRVNGGYKSNGVANLTEENFFRLCSQTSLLAKDPEKPILDPRVEALVLKARESALAAVQHYNNPTTLFRSDNYIVLMIIAFTALFHAIFERDGIDYIAYDKNGVAKTVDGGEKMLWDLLGCARFYEKNKPTPMLTNIEFIVPIRHKIEHRFLPAIDREIVGHCHSMLMNFETVLRREFTDYYSLNESLALALQFSTQRTPETLRAIRGYHTAEYAEIKRYMSEFHARLSDELFSDPAFAFRVWLIPKLANEARRSDLSIEFIYTDQLSPEQSADMEQAVVAIRRVVEKSIVDPAEQCTMWESEMVEAVRRRLGDTVKFGGGTRRITAPLIRTVLISHAISDKSEMYYRGSKPGSRPMYGEALINWLEHQYKLNDQIFFDARLMSVRENLNA